TWFVQVMPSKLVKATPVFPTATNRIVPLTDEATACRSLAVITWVVQTRPSLLVATSPPAPTAANFARLVRAATLVRSAAMAGVTDVTAVQLLPSMLVIKVPAAPVATQRPADELTTPYRLPVPPGRVAAAFQLTALSSE